MMEWIVKDYTDKVNADQELKEYRDWIEANAFGFGERCFLWMWNVFLPHIEIEHIDKGETEYQTWKEKHSAEVTQQVIKMTHEYYHGTRPIYYNPFQ